MKFEIFLLLLMLIRVRGGGAECMHKGMEYEIGETFKDECNECTCQSGGNVKCTEQSCSCMHKGMEYGLGDTFNDECNECTCGSGGNVKCTEKSCKCMHKGMEYGLGDTFKDECNECTCQSGGNVECTEQSCSCMHKGMEYGLGDTFNDECNECTCGSGGNVKCTEKSCKCMHKGMEYEIGETFNDECNECTCQSGGNVKCTEQSCSCMHKEMEYGLGDTFNDECNECTCQSDGNVECTEKSCNCSLVKCKLEECKDGHKKFIPVRACCPHCVKQCPPCPMISCIPGYQFVLLPGDCCETCVPGKCANGLSPIPETCGGIIGIPCKTAGYICDFSNLPPDTRDGFGICCKDCPDIRCRKGYISVTPRGESCPICIKDCTKIHCFYIKCPFGLTPRVLEGDCCPTCVKDCRSVYCLAVCEAGYKAEIPEGECCPKCVQECAFVECPRLPCPKEKQLETQEGECCPKCVKDCLFVKCLRRLTCQEGYISEKQEGTCCPKCVKDCLSVLCPRVNCDFGYKPEVPEGECCEKCVKDCRLVRCLPYIGKCANGYKVAIPEGECCEKCVKDCSRTLCHFITCGTGYKMETPEGECCSECVKDCTIVKCPFPKCAKGYTLEVPIGECCPVCVKGCSSVRCKYIKCRGGYKLEKLKGKCCPECVRDCLTVKCAKVECTNAYIPRGECCPICPECPPCPMISCRPGYHPIVLPGDCCATCIPGPGRCSNGLRPIPELCGGFQGLQCKTPGYTCDFSNLPPGSADGFGMCCKDLDAGNCPYGTPIPGHFCGRGGYPCPANYYCNISPVDAFAECCPLVYCSCQDVQSQIPDAKSGVYHLINAAGEVYTVYCDFHPCYMDTYIKPTNISTLNIRNLYNTRNEILLRHVLQDGTQKEVAYGQIREYEDIDIAVQYTSNNGYNDFRSNATDSYIYVGLIPNSGVINASDIQGYRINGIDYNFTNCNGESNSYVVLLLNEEDDGNMTMTASPTELIRKWIDDATPVPSDRELPVEFFSLFEMRHGGCGGSLTTDQLVQVTGATIGLRYQKGCCRNGISYADGETIPTDDPCEHCSCVLVEGIYHIACVFEDCARPPCKYPVSVKDVCCPVCTGTCDYKGVVYSVGDTFNDQCNTCNCLDGGVVACTRIFCINHCSNGLVPRNETCGGIGALKCPTGYECDFSYVPPDVIDGAGICCKAHQCRDGRTPLSHTICGKDSVCPRRYNCEPAKGDVFGYCCQERPCTVNGMVYQSGESYYDECNACTCHDGVSICTLIACADGCYRNGVRYDAGESIPSADPCVHCRCYLVLGTHRIVCALQGCPRLPCTNPIHIEGKCCPVCPIVCKKPVPRDILHNTTEVIPQRRRVVGDCYADINRCPVGSCILKHEIIRHWRWMISFAAVCPVYGVIRPITINDTVDCGPTFGSRDIEWVASCVCEKDPGILLDVFVVDAKNTDTLLPGITVHLNGAQLNDSSVDGHFKARVSSLTEKVIVSAVDESGEFIASIKVVDIPIGVQGPLYVIVPLVKTADPIPIDPTILQILAIATDPVNSSLGVATLTIKPHTIRYPNGSLYNDTVQLSLNVIDVSDLEDDAEIPGQFLTSDSSIISPLISDGLFALTLRDSNGTLLEVESVTIGVRDGMTLWTLGDDGMWEHLPSSGGGMRRRKRQISLDELTVNITNARWVNIDKIPGAPQCYFKARVFQTDGTTEITTSTTTTFVNEVLGFITSVTPNQRLRMYTPSTRDPADTCFSVRCPEVMSGTTLTGFINMTSYESVIVGGVNIPVIQSLTPKTLGQYPDFQDALAAILYQKAPNNVDIFVNFVSNATGPFYTNKTVCEASSFLEPAFHFVKPPVPSYEPVPAGTELCTAKIGITWSMFNETTYNLSLPISSITAVSVWSDNGTNYYYTDSVDFDISVLNETTRFLSVCIKYRCSNESLTPVYLTVNSPVNNVTGSPAFNCICRGIRCTREGIVAGFIPLPVLFPVNCTQSTRNQNIAASLYCATRK